MFIPLPLLPVDAQFHCQETRSGGEPLPPPHMSHTADNAVKDERKYAGVIKSTW